MHFLLWLFSIIDIRTVILALVVLLLTKWLLSRERNLPPGPWGLPIVGYLPFLRGKPMQIAVTELGKKYGNVLSFYLGNVLVVILGDYAAIKEAFVKQGFIFSGKPESNVFKVKESDKGLLLSEGEEANEIRRFTISCLREFGMGKTSLEPKILDEIKHFLQAVEETNGQPINLNNHIKRSVANVISALEFGHRFDYNDKEFEKLLFGLNVSNEFIAAISAVLFLPWMVKMPFVKKILKLDRFMELSSLFEDIFKRKINEHEENHVEGNAEDYIDAHIAKKRSEKQKTGSEGCFGDDYLLGNLGALFGAGIDTISTSLLWSLLYMMKHPKIMQKVQQEIDEVIGPDNEPTILHKPKMPYTEATLLEVLRASSVAPFTLSHGNLEETTLFGYRIPKGSFILGNLWAVNHSQWENPDEFQPERFLNENGQVQKPEYFIPFSIGKRNCIGESLAHMQLFLYFTSFFQQFSVQLPPNEKSSLEYNFGITLTPKPFNVCAIKRKP